MARKKAEVDIWTIELTLQLYRELMKRFGPHRIWGLTSYPAGDEFGFNEFCEFFAAAHGAKSADAVKMQISWATGHQPMIKNRHNMRNIFRNKLCAWDVDFIDARLMPAWTMNWYIDVSDHLKEVTRNMMNNVVYGESKNIDEMIEAEISKEPVDDEYDEILATSWGVAV